MTGVKGWFVHPNHHHHHEQSEPTPELGLTPIPRHRRWSWRHPSPSPSPSPSTPAWPSEPSRRTTLPSLSLSPSPNHTPSTLPSSSSAPASLLTSTTETWLTLSSLPSPLPSPSPSAPSIRRRRAPSMTRPLHPTGQTRFKPTRPTWRFLKNLRALPHPPKAVKGKPKREGTSTGHDTVDWDTEPEKDTKKLFGNTLRRRRAASPRPLRPASPTRSPASPTRSPTRPTSPTARAASQSERSLGRSPSRLKWRRSRPTTPSRTTSPNSLRPISPGPVPRLSSVSTMTTLISTATSSPSTSQTTLPIPLPKPKNGISAREVIAAQEAQKKRARSTSSVHIALGAVFGCALALSPWPALAAALAMVLAIVLASLCPTVRVRGAQAYTVCGEAATVAVAAVYRWAQERKR